MVQQTETAAPAAPAPETTQVAEVAEETAPELESQPPQETLEAAETPPVTFEDYLARDENLKSAADLRLEEVREEGRRKAQSEMQPRLERMNAAYGDYQRNAQAAAQGINEMNQSLRELVESGSIEVRDLQKVFNGAPQAWQAMSGLTAQGERWQTYLEATKVAADKVGDKEILAEYTSRFNNAAAGAESYGEVMGDMVQALVGASVERAKKPLQDRIRVLEAALEGRKQESRAGSGPAEPARGGGGTIRSYSEAERRYNLPSTHPEHITHDQFKEERQRFGIKDR